MFPSITLTRTYVVFSQHGDETIPLYVKSAALAVARAIAHSHGWAYVESAGKVVWDSRYDA